MFFQKNPWTEKKMQDVFLHTTPKTKMRIERELSRKLNGKGFCILGDSGFELSEYEAEKLVMPMYDHTNLISLTGKKCIPFPEKSLDFILLHFCFHYMDNMELLFDEIDHVLKERGKVLIVDSTHIDKGLKRFNPSLAVQTLESNGFRVKYSKIQLLEKPEEQHIHVIEGKKQSSSSLVNRFLNKFKGSR